MLPKIKLVGILLFFIMMIGSTKVASSSNLQTLIDQAEEGGTVTIPSGTYTGSVTINKPLTVIGQDKVIINADGETPAIIVKNKGVTIKNIVVENSTSDYAIYVTGSHHSLQNVTVKTAHIGIRLNEASHIKINGAKVTGLPGAEEAGNGIDLYRSKENVITNNRVNNIRDGIYLEYSNANTIMGNQITHSRYGLHFMYTEDNIVRNNTLSDNHTGSMIMVSNNELYENNYLLRNRQNVNSQGLYLYDVHDSTFKDNHINDNRIGIMIDNSFTNKIQHNEFQGNALGIIFKQSTDNSILSNDFKINVTTILTYGDGSNQNKLYGNYWDNQQGLDVNGDRFSDLKVIADPYFIEITDKNSAFQLLFQSPGMMLMEKLFKSEENQLVKDVSPAMKPNRLQEKTETLNLGTMYISILFILSSIIFYLMGRKKLQ